MPTNYCLPIEMTILSVWVCDTVSKKLYLPWLENRGELILRYVNIVEYIPTGNFHFVRASVPERLALPASNVAVGSVFNLVFLFFTYFM